VKKSDVDIAIITRNGLAKEQ